MNIIEEFKAVLAKKGCVYSSDASGIHTNFFIINNNVGIRCYFNKENCVLNYKAQAKLCKLEVAPNILSGIHTLKFQGERLYFYATEKVLVYKDYSSAIYSALGGDYRINNDFVSEMRIMLYDAVEKFAAKLQKEYNYILTDKHLGNFGVSDTFGIVVIDFSEAIWEAQGRDC